MMIIYIIGIILILFLSGRVFSKELQHDEDPSGAYVGIIVAAMFWPFILFITLCIGVLAGPIWCGVHWREVKEFWNSFKFPRPRNIFKKKSKEK